MELKTETLNLRVTPAFKDLVREAAERERRSISNLIEVLVHEHCQKSGIQPSEAPGTSRDQQGD